MSRPRRDWDTDIDGGQVKPLPLAVTEFMVWVTGLRPPQPLLTYRAERGIVRQSIDPPNQGCPYCSEARRRQTRLRHSHPQRKSWRGDATGVDGETTTQKAR